jgi:hypothetical protein
MANKFNPNCRANIEAYLERKTVPEPNTGCLLWVAGADKDGYGKLIYEKRHRRAHCVAFEVANGSIPAGGIVQHKCDTPACCNPNHLVLGTPLTNMQDKVIKGRLVNQYMDASHCIRGHEFSAENTKIETNGKRTCIRCRRDRAGVRATGPVVKQTHCKRGHEFTPESVYRYGNTRVCKACAKIRGLLRAKSL